MGRISPKNAPGYRVVTSSVTYWDLVPLKTFSSLSPIPIVSKRFFLLVTQVKKDLSLLTQENFCLSTFYVETFFSQLKTISSGIFQQLRSNKKNYIRLFLFEHQKFQMIKRFSFFNFKFLFASAGTFCLRVSSRPHFLPQPFLVFFLSMGNSFR